MSKKKKAKPAGLKKLETELKALEKELKANTQKTKSLKKKSKHLEKAQVVLERKLGQLDVEYADTEDAAYQTKRAIKNFSAQLPKTGAFTCYKKACQMDGIGNRVIIKLHVPADAKRNTPLGEKKSRVSKAKVLSITDRDGISYKKARSLHNSLFVYEVGKMVKPDRYSKAKNEVCTNGIHVFLKKKDAEAY